MISLLISFFAFGQNTYTSSPEVPPPSTSLPNSDVNKIYDYPEKMPEFPDGLLVFREKFSKNIVLDKIKKQDGELALKCFVSFVVERDGSITDLKVAGKNEEFNKEVYKAIRSIKERWKPANHKGEIVRSRFKIPMTIQ